MTRGQKTLLILVGTGLAVAAHTLTAWGGNLFPGDYPDSQKVSSCGLVNPAFCETFSAPAGIGNRSGALNGTVWGVSRTGQQGNPGQGQWNAWSTSALHPCGEGNPFPPNDLQICNGQLVDTLNDGGGMAILAMYPKQPFDIAGRTGKVVFDVNNDTQGIHAAWPEFEYTDQPVPAPTGKEATVEEPYARNSFGLSFAGLCPGCRSFNAGNCSTVDRAFMTRDYGETDLKITVLDCVLGPTRAGQLNHFEIDLSQNEVDVYATDAGAAASTQRLIAKVTGFTMPLTRGLVWIEDVHYNACKFDAQCDHIFVWDNVGFDGPLLPRDLTFDVLDAGNPSLGWNAPTPPLSTLPAVSAANISAASGAAVLFSWFPTGNDAPVTVQLNGGPVHSAPWPFPGHETFVWRTIAVSVPLSEVKTGANTIAITTNSGGQDVVANVDLALIGAGGIVPCDCGGGTPTSTPSPSPDVDADAKPGTDREIRIRERPPLSSTR